MARGKSWRGRVNEPYRGEMDVADADLALMFQWSRQRSLTKQVLPHQAIRVWGKRYEHMDCRYLRRLHLHCTSRVLLQKAFVSNVGSLAL